jgi:thiol-disulfide isomerase/thioredoxin
VSQRKARKRRDAERSERPPDSPARRLLRDRRVWAVAGLAGLVVLLGAGILLARGNGSAQPIVERGGDAVSFSGTDPVTGRQVSLDSFADEPVVVNVWGSWCPGCNVEAPDLRRFASAHPEVQVVGVDLQDSKDAAKAFYRRWRWAHPSVFDPDGKISYSLGLQGTPSTFFLDRQHRIVTRIVGATDRAGFEQGLQAAIVASRTG